MVFMFMMNLKAPANLQFFNEILVGLLNVEVIDPEWSTKLVFDFSIDESFIDDAFNEEQDMFLQS